MNIYVQNYIKEGKLNSFPVFDSILERCLCFCSRLKALETESYSQEEANRAAGLGSYVAPRKFEIKTQPKKEVIIQVANQQTTNLQDFFLKEKN